MKFTGICKNKDCNKKHEFNPNGKASEILFCSDTCWKSNWVKDVSGLVHPHHNHLFFNAIRNKLGKEIYKEALNTLKFNNINTSLLPQN